MVNSFNGSRNVLVAEVHWLHPALVGGASPAWRWGWGTDKERGWFNARLGGAMVQVLRHPVATGI